MTNAPTATETAQLLLKEIGRQPLLDYFTKRLQIGKDLNSRPLLVRAYAHLAGADGTEMLVQIANDPTEQVQARVVATKALANLAKQLPKTVEESELTKPLVELLRDDNIEVRSAAAAQLASLQSREALPLLQELSRADKLDVLAGEEVRKFLAATNPASIDNLAPFEKGTSIAFRPQLQQLRLALANSQIVQLVGMGGMGKTMLARQFVIQSEYDVKVWCSCRNSASFEDLTFSLFMEVMAALGIRSYSFQQEETVALGLGFAEIRARIVYHLSNRSALIIFDDFETVREAFEVTEFIEKLVAELPRLNCLIVGRTAADIRRGAVVTLEGLTQEESRLFIRELASSYDLALDPVIEQMIVDKAAGLPLALRLFAEAYSHGALTDPASITKDAMAAVVAQAFHRLDRPETRALEILCQFDEPFSIRDPEINELFMQEHVGSLPDLLPRFQKMAFVNLTPDGRIGLHELVREYLRSQADQRTALRVNRFLAQYYEKRGDLSRAAIHYVRAGTEIDQVLPQLIGALTTGDGMVGKSAVEALGQSGQTRAVEVLFIALGVPDAAIRKAAVETLGKLGDTRAVGPLVTVLGDIDATVRRAAIEALGKSGDPRAVEPLLHATEDNDAQVRKSAAEALRQLKSN